MKPMQDANQAHNMGIRYVSYLLLLTAVLFFYGCNKSTPKLSHKSMFDTALANYKLDTSKQPIYYKDLVNDNTAKAYLGSMLISNDADARYLAADMLDAQNSLVGNKKVLEFLTTCTDSSDPALQVILWRAIIKKQSYAIDFVRLTIDDNNNINRKVLAKLAAGSSSTYYPVLKHYISSTNNKWPLKFLLSHSESNAKYADIKKAATIRLQYLENIR